MGRSSCGESFPTSVVSMDNNGCGEGESRRMPSSCLSARLAILGSGSGGGTPGPTANAEDEEERAGRDADGGRGRGVAKGDTSTSPTGVGDA